jgi:hypothetical protein
MFLSSILTAAIGNSKLCLWAAGLCAAIKAAGASAGVRKAQLLSLGNSGCSLLLGRNFACSHQESMVSAKAILVLPGKVLQDVSSLLPAKALPLQPEKHQPEKALALLQADKSWALLPSKQVLGTVAL